MTLSPSRIETPRLVLVPVSRELAQAIIGGDVSAIEAGEGWPHDDTVDGLQMALAHGHTPGWFVTLGGTVIGDCGVHRDPDELGEVEIGFGLAAPYRGKGYGSELVTALSRWLLEQPGVELVCARTALENEPSRRALGRAGYALESSDERHAKYTLRG